MNERELIQKLLQISGFEKLNPVQRKAIEKGLLKGKNLVIFAPTASGKTFIAELAALKTILNERKKVIYMVPLVALANEKFDEFKEKYEKMGVKVALSVGDYDSSDPWLARYDFIIVSNEKMDSLIRHGAGWIRDVGLIVVDEIHLLGEGSRGPTLEITLTLLREMIPNAQILALSATIKNAKELAGWLKADTVISEWRPVKLYKGVAFPYIIRLVEGKTYELEEDVPLEASITRNTLKMRKQVLFFVSTRRSAESLAEKLGKITKNFLGKREAELLKKLADDVENVLEVPTKQCRRIARCLRMGSAFHHAGLLYKQRKMIEDNFRNGLIKVIVATPSLAYGVNLPSFRVVMRDLKRYQPSIGSVFVPVLDVQQMLGRAGRPKYDSFGEGIILAKNEEEAEEIIDYYIHGEPEDIRSRLAIEPILRMHSLALVASEFCKSKKSLLKFFLRTFYAFQYGDTSLIERKISDILNVLEEWGFVTEKNDRLRATTIGRRVSELYIDPLTAHFFIDCLKKASERNLQPFSFLQLISNTLEMKPLPGIRTGEFAELNEIVAEREDQILQEIPEEWDLEFNDFLKSIKSALMFEAWINEATEDEILTKFNVTPGEFYGRRQIADWLLYSLHELALLLGLKDLLKHIRKVRVRLEYGVKEELIKLVRLKNIGRIRARKIFNAGLTDLKKLREIPLESLSILVGPKIAYSIKEQLGQAPKRKKFEERQKTLKSIE